MKSTIFTFFATFIFFYANSQNTGDTKSFSVFGSQPTWKQLSSEDSFRRMTFADYFGCKKDDSFLCWNAVQDGAEAQLFYPTDSLLIVQRGSTDYLYKIGCKNRLRYIRTIRPEPVTITPPVKPTTVVVADTIRKTVVIEEEVVRVQRKSGYTIQGAYQTQGSYWVGDYCPPPPVYCAPQPRYCPPPRRYCPPPPPPPCVNKYYGHNRRGR